MDHLNKIIDIAEQLGWSVNVTEPKNYICFSQNSPAGQDFFVGIKYDDVKEIPKKVMNFYEAYDVSYETYLWLDDNGHGTNGAPYDMKDLYEDMQACEDMTKKLSDALNSIKFG